MQRSLAQLKRTLRQLKKTERKLRFGDQPSMKGRKLVWDLFFSTKDGDQARVRYTLGELLQMDRTELKEVITEYFCYVYFQKYKECGIRIANLYDPELLSLLGLPPSSGIQEIKKRFRELAKKHHPDHGGDRAQFIELMDIYEKLIGQ